jgi:hypothetical protein
MVPFDVRPLFVNAVMVTKGTPCVTTKLQLDPAKIAHTSQTKANKELLKRNC